ncbi:zinc-binding dehydrogenase [Paenibacillus humicus]|uniref:zinc-binding dehydrogenase n=1 Tax=Paenibacillus humicus TaxID=412861 RepID=UPI003D2B4F11
MRINQGSIRTSVFQGRMICCLTVPYYIGKSIGISPYSRKEGAHRTSGGLFSQSINVTVESTRKPHARLAELVELHSKGKLHIHIRETFKLDRVGDDHQAIETRHGRGKIVLTLD